MEHLKQLIDYIDDHLYQGYAEDHIRQVLLQHNWHPQLIEEAFWRVKNPGFVSGYDQSELPALQLGAPAEVTQYDLPPGPETTSKSTLSFQLFSGRLGRGEYLLGLIFMLVPLLLCLVLALFGAFVLADSTYGSSIAAFNMIIMSIVGALGVASIFIIIPSLLVRRLHDLNQSGWWAVPCILFIPFAGLILALLPGTKGENQYGKKHTAYDYLGIMGLRQLD